MKTSRNGLKSIPEKQMPEWARVASQAHKEQHFITAGMEEKACEFSAHSANIYSKA